jgi:lipopolysaccharide transport system ATP-binding protein
VGDAFFTQKCIRFLRKFREQGTLLFVSHDSASVVNLCHEAIWLEKGKMRIQASAKDVCEAYLAAFYEEQQGPSTIKASSKESTKKQQSEPLQKIIKDQRLEYINLSHHRNDIQVFGFDVNAPAFGKGGAQIVNVLLVSEDGAHLSWVVGGELVTVVVCVEALQDIYAPIVGFIVKDRLGQALFSDNTFLTYTKNPVQIGAGTFFEARFTFQMPILPGGDYVIAVSVAEGTQVEHIQHHWMHDALVLKSHSSSVCTGLVGIPMLDIKLNRVEMSEVSSTV